MASLRGDTCLCNFTKKTLWFLDNQPAIQHVICKRDHVWIFYVRGLYVNFISTRRTKNSINSPLYKTPLAVLWTAAYPTLAQCPVSSLLFLSLPPPQATPHYHSACCARLLARCSPPSLEHGVPHELAASSQVGEARAATLAIAPSATILLLHSL